jgi:hypothetical protein
MLGPASIMATGEIYPKHLDMIKLIKKSFGDRRLRVGYSIRNPAGYIESSYSSLVLHGFAESFADYTQHISPTRTRWEPVVSSLVEEFGEENVYLWTFEDFVKDAKKSLHKIMSLSIPNLSQLAVTVEGPQNVSYASDALPIAMQWNKIQRERGLSDQERTRLRRRMRILLNKIGGEPKIKRLLPDDTIAAFTEAYQNEVSEIRRKWPNLMLDLQTA